MRKTLKRSKNKNKSKSRRQKTKSRRRGRRGGVTNYFLAPSKYDFANKVDCSNMNVDVINDMKELHSRYQKCCPKNMFGYKNSSAICKKMDTRFNELWKQENDARGYYGYDNPPSNTP
jgi:hypothetical protein